MYCSFREVVIRVFNHKGSLVNVKMIDTMSYVNNINIGKLAQNSAFNNSSIMIL